MAIDAMTPPDSMMCCFILAMEPSALASFAQDSEPAFQHPGAGIRVFVACFARDISHF
jgi:hypothetical protein